MLLFFQPLTATMQQEGFINLVMHASEHITTQNLSSVSSAWESAQSAFVPHWSWERQQEHWSNTGAILYSEKIYVQGGFVLTIETYHINVILA